jgi:hypothetical protein
MFLKLITKEKSMKKIIFLTAFILSSVSSISMAANCPANTKKEKTCLSTPQAGDAEIAANVFDSVTICSQGTTSILVFEKNGTSENAEATVTARMGGTSYEVKAGDVDFTLTTVSRIINKKIPAKLVVNYTTAKVVAASTYSCSL